MALTKASYSMIKGAAANVLDFGAIGDGSTDDTAAIQAAFDAAYSVYFPTGNYKTTGTLTINKSNMVITGDNDVNILPYLTTDTPALYIYSGAALTNIDINNVWFDLSNTSVATDGIVARGISRCNFYKVHVTGNNTNTRNGWVIYNEDESGSALTSGYTNKWEMCRTIRTIDTSWYGNTDCSANKLLNNNLFINCVTGTSNTLAYKWAGQGNMWVNPEVGLVTGSYSFEFYDNGVINATQENVINGGYFDNTLKPAIIKVDAAQNAAPLTVLAGINFKYYSNTNPHNAGSNAVLDYDSDGVTPVFNRVKLIGFRDEVTLSVNDWAVNVRGAVDLTAGDDVTSETVDTSDFQWRNEAGNNLFIIGETNGGGGARAPKKFYIPTGSTGSRYIASYIGACYFDQTIGKPIWWDGSNWVDATGSSV